MINYFHSTDFENQITSFFPKNNNGRNEMNNIRLSYTQKKTAAGAAVSLSQGNQFSNYKKVNMHLGAYF